MRSILKVILFLAIVAAGFAIYSYLIKTRHVPERTPSKERPTVVVVRQVKPSDKPVMVSAMGTVVPAKSVTIFPEVPGRILYQNPKLIPGGRFEAGEILIRIDPRDYDLAVKQQQATVVQAETELARERGLKRVAEREWSLIQDEVQPTQEGRRLALREIQLENAQARLASAKSGMEQAELMRKRTVIRAPFNSLVTEELVDTGQVVSNASKIATLVASDKFWVRASVPVDRLGWIRIPFINGKEGSAVRVVQQAGPNFRVERKGQVIKLLGDLDPRGKMARLLVEVDQPLGNPGENGRLLPLLLDAYVHVYIQGQRAEGVLSLPRLALRDQDRIWVKNQEKRLEIRKVEVVWSEENTVFVRGDLQGGEQVITSRIAAPVEGMLVVTSDEQDKMQLEKDQPSPSQSDQPKPDRAESQP